MAGHAAWDRRPEQYVRGPGGSVDDRGTADGAPSFFPSGQSPAEPVLRKVPKQRRSKPAAQQGEKRDSRPFEIEKIAGTGLSNELEALC